MLLFNHEKDRAAIMAYNLLISPKINYSENNTIH